MREAVIAISHPDDTVIPDSTTGIHTELRVKRMIEGKRLDRYLVDRFPEYSRSLLQKAITTAQVTVNQKKVKRSYLIKKGDIIGVQLPPLADETPIPEDIPIDIIYEDEFFLVLNKAAGMVVHPAKANWTGTMVNAIQFHLDSLSSIAGALRPGIVHRLDRDTSGVILVAKDDVSHSDLAMQFEERTVKKEYVAIVCGTPDRDSDFIEQPLGPHPTHREKMAIRSLEDGGKSAKSFYRVQQRFRGFAMVAVEPHSGRTHQIRVHLAHIGCPVLADYAYGGRRRLCLSDLTGEVADEDNVTFIGRQALHAHRLTLRHPRTGKSMTIEAPLPDDMNKALESIRTHRGLT